MKNSEPFPTPFGQAELGELLRGSGWEGNSDEVGEAYFTLTLNGRVIQTIPLIKPSGNGHILAWRYSVSTPRFSRSAGHILNERRRFYPMTNTAARSLSAANLTQDVVRKDLHRLIAEAERRDVAADLAACLALNPWSPGNGPIRLLAALASTGAKNRIATYLEGFEAGDRMGFLPYVTIDHLRRALEAVKLTNEQ